MSTKCLIKLDKSNDKLIFRYLNEDNTDSPWHLYTVDVAWISAIHRQLKSNNRIDNIIITFK